MRRRIGVFFLLVARSCCAAVAALVIPAVIGVLPVIAALSGQSWSWVNPWSWVGIAAIAAGALVALSYPIASLFRKMIDAWTGVAVPAGYSEAMEPIRMATGFWFNGHSYERTRSDALRDQRWRRLIEPAFRRDVRWSLAAAVVVGGASSVFVGAIVASIWRMCMHHMAWDYLIASGAIVIAAVALAAMWPVTLILARHLLITPVQQVRSPATLRLQRAELTAAHDAEIRRIERDLHDGAQAHIVSVGLSLATAERLFDTDPEQARALIGTAREVAAESLCELRELVHSIYPPVLIERGLVPAVHAVALNNPLAITVTATDTFPRLLAPKEAALYFCIVELLTNASRHSGADSAHVDFDVERARQAMMVVTVSDAGQGGATRRTGGGLDGISRRIAAFDGDIALESPAGGPTVITVRMPCE